MDGRYEGSFASPGYQFTALDFFVTPYIKLELKSV